MQAPLRCRKQGKWQITAKQHPNHLYSLYHCSRWLKGRHELSVLGVNRHMGSLQGVRQDDPEIDHGCFLLSSISSVLSAVAEGL